ncbi:ubiquinone biosynthesis protein [Sinosporangium album]|uniref:Ubiquinone biosynthesis protein n=1 Tax=Sinosporangium album TaxID=504805 RepID=A0A1G7S2M8_9ACTN|nr:AarF/UbiB family protein [Sinosporangium album]SDG17243.1 ubiquinone biosynthesis protein [Sinosporangium album]
MLRLARISGSLAWHLVRLIAQLVLNPAMRGRSAAAIAGMGAAAFCESCGATFVKVGQILSMRTDLIPAETAAELSRLRDRMRPVNRSAALRIVEKQLGSPVDRLFLDFGEKPVASAGIASVYRARLPDGRLVAVKVRRPGITRVVSDDLMLMRALARHLKRIPGFSAFPLLETADEIGALVQAQLDLRKEAENLRALGLNFADNPLVRLPGVVEGYCAEAVLTMEFIQPPAATGDGTRRALVTALRSLYRMIFIDGLVHCDLHHGNLHLGGDGNVVMFDAGFVVRLSDAERIRFAKFFYGVLSNSGADCASIIRQTAVALPASFDEKAFTGDVTALISTVSGTSADAFDVIAFVLSVFRLQRQHRLHSSTAFITPILALLVMEGVVKQLAPDLRFQEEARPYLAACLLPSLLRSRRRPF